MRFVAVDWGTSRVRAMQVADGAVVDRAESDEGVSRLRPGEHAAVFERLCGAWLAAEPERPVFLVGMVGSREGWFPAPYASCPAGSVEIAAALTPVELGHGRHGVIVPGMRFDGTDSLDVMRGEETHLLGSGVVDGLVCLPGTHCKWAEMRAGRIARFATFVTGEMYALLREHSMIGRPACDPPDPSGFADGLEAAWRRGDAAGPVGLLHQLFSARAATVTGRLSSDRLGPFLSGLLTGHEIAGAFAAFGMPTRVTIVADPPRAGLYAEALARRGVETTIAGQEATLLAGLTRILEAQRAA